MPPAAPPITPFHKGRVQRGPPALPEPAEPGSRCPRRPAALRLPVRRCVRCPAPGDAAALGWPELDPAQPAPAWAWMSSWGGPESP